MSSWKNVKTRSVRRLSVHFTSRALFHLCSCGAESVSHNLGNYILFKTILFEPAGSKTSIYLAARLGMSSGPSLNFWHKTSLTGYWAQFPWGDVRNPPHILSWSVKVLSCPFEVRNLLFWIARKIGNRCLNVVWILQHCLLLKISCKLTLIVRGTHSKARDSFIATWQWPRTVFGHSLRSPLEFRPFV